MKDGPSQADFVGTRSSASAQPRQTDALKSVPTKAPQPTPQSGNDQGRRILVARRVTLAAVFVAVIVSLAFDSGLGTPSAFGIGEFFLLCPIGGIEAMVASKSFIPIAAISMAVVLVLALVFGRAWCAWGCPAPVIRRFFRREPKSAESHSGSHQRHSEGEARRISPVRSAGDPSPSPRMTSRRPFTPREEKPRLIPNDPRSWMFVAVVVAAFVAGFPLFCLVCPVGLTFGTVGSLWHLIVDKQVTLSVLVFPAALIVELVLYRKWCLNLCPIAGLLGIVGRAARLFRPRINAETCLRYHDGADCSVCVNACSENINMHEPDAAAQLGECTRCGECAAQCPTASIALKLAASDPVVRKS